jgi:hypothetical protein
MSPSVEELADFLHLMLCNKKHTGRIEDWGALSQDPNFCLYYMELSKQEQPTRLKWLDRARRLQELGVTFAEIRVFRGAVEEVVRRLEKLDIPLQFSANICAEFLQALTD